jgi:hypothetical protein
MMSVATTRPLTPSLTVLWANHTPLRPLLKDGPCLRFGVWPTAGVSQSHAGSS